MAHTYVSELIHCVFSTKQRRNLISSEVQQQLWEFLGGIARKNGFKALIVGGTENHVHMLLSLPATMPLAKAMQLVKGASSHWMNEKFKTDFAWRMDTARLPSVCRRKATRSHTFKGRPSIIASAISRRNFWRS